MSTEAQRLISVSLTKIAQSRSQRGGVSLHKNLLVATVLQRARYIFMEEAYHMVQVHSAAQPRHPQQPPPQQSQQHQDEYDEEGLVALTAEEAGCESTTSTEESSTSSTSSAHLQEFLPPSCERCCPEEDKENQLPPPYTPGDHPTYLDLDKEEKVLKERTNSPPPTSPSSKTLKRRRVAEWETEEAVSSILPKRVKSSSPVGDAEESVFLDDASLNSDSDSDDDEDDDDDDDNNGESSMEIDRITSLVSIFSFGGLGDASIGKLTRSVSTPDLCSSQAKEGVTDSLQQRPFLAMTV